MVTKKLVKGPQIGVGDVIEFENLSSDCIKTGNERNDYMPALSEKMVRTDTVDRWKIRTSGWSANM